MQKTTRRSFLASMTALIAISPLSGCPASQNPYYQMGWNIGIKEWDIIKRFFITVIANIEIVIVPFLNKYSKDKNISDFLETINMFKTKHMKDIDLPLDNIEINNIGDIVERFIDGLHHIKATEDAMRIHSPNNWHKLCGIADGTLGRAHGLIDSCNPFRKLFFFVRHFEFAPTVLGHLFAGEIQACSALALRSSMTDIGFPAFIKNFDFSEIAKDINIVRRTYPPSGYPSLDVTVAPFETSITTFNGLVVTTGNWCLGSDMGGKHLGISCSMQDATERTRNVFEAIDFLKAQPNGGYHIIPMADANGNLARLDCTPYGKFEYIEENKPYLVTTNHYLEDRPGATNPVPDSVSNNTYGRYDALVGLMQEAEISGKKLSKDNLFTIMGVAANADTQITSLVYPGLGKVFCRSKNIDNGREFVIEL